MSLTISNPPDGRSTLSRRIADCNVVKAPAFQPIGLARRNTLTLRETALVLCLLVLHHSHSDPEGFLTGFGPLALEAGSSRAM
jgi:hypothetical protein